MDTIEQQFTNFAATFEVLDLIGLLFLLLIVGETVWDFIAKNRPNLKESMANAAIAIGNSLLERTAYGLVFVVALFITEAFAFTTIPYTWWSWLLALLVADFTYYWMHRFEHEVRILWAYHSVHHSSPEFNLTTGLRLAWVEGLVEWLFFVPMILLGFSAMQTLIAIAIVVLYQTWIHTEKVGKLGWVDRVFNTPSVHRVHHGSNKQYHDKNYGGILIVWDRLFGTYKAEKEQAIYGITTPVGTANPVTINFHEFMRIAKDMAAANSVKEVLAYAFKRPGWKPEDATLLNEKRR